MFAQLEISEFAENFTKEGIDMEALVLCNEDDLKDGGLPLGPRKKLMKYLEDRTRARNGDTISGLEKFQQQSIESEVKYIFGPAGTGQPSVTYPVILKRVLSVLFFFKKYGPFSDHSCLFILLPSQHQIQFQYQQ